MRDGAAILGREAEQRHTVCAQHFLVVAALAAQVDDAPDVVRTQELLGLVHLESPTHRKLRRNPAQIHRGWYRRVMRAQNSANSSGYFGGLVWCGCTPRCSGVKQYVSVSRKSSSAAIWRSNHFSQPGW